MGGCGGEMGGVVVRGGSGKRWEGVVVRDGRVWW